MRSADSCSRSSHWPRWSSPPGAPGAPRRTLAGPERQQRDGARPARAVRRRQRRLRPQRRRRDVGGRHAGARTHRGWNGRSRPGMIPVIPLEFAGYSKLQVRHATCLPTDRKAIGEYVAGLHHDRPEKSSPATRPCRSCSRRSTSRGATAPRGEYAAFLALPAAGSSRSRTSAAVRRLRRRDGPRLGAARCTPAQPQLRTQIQGWYAAPLRPRTRSPARASASCLRIRWLKWPLGRTT